MRKIIFTLHWVQQGDTWILHDVMGRAVGMILVTSETDDYPVFHLDKGRVTV